MKEGVGMIQCKKKETQGIRMNTQIKNPYVSRNLKKPISHYKLI